ncbi:MAG: hypothetical protein AN483_16215 [Aphanizomenon flos-aquae MDT14a]|jgi:energy-coupling factor transporter ATP-binding protein EcfA2|nr:MAG: hypothetical protein AN483_16215 [Aphanizomenon flos-aquae MDT14a]QSV68504.1 MAG: AAA family ATPase [Aphanizomenon flos-aquae DEX188]
MKQKNQKINHEVLQCLSEDIENKSLVCLIGANMSGKSTLINKLRQEANSKTEIIFAVRIDRTINNIIFSSGESEFRINDISPFVSNIMKETCKLDPTLSSIDVGEFYNQVIKDVNIFIKEFDSKILISCKEETSIISNINNDIERSLKKLSGVKHFSELELDQTKLNKFKEDIETQIKDFITKNTNIVGNYSKKEKVFWIKYHQEREVKITDVSSGLESLIILLFIVETLKYFDNYSNKIKYWLMIDEPESYLHPKWQKELLSYLSSIINQNIKVLFATHSQYMIPTDNLDCIGIVTRSDEKGISYKNISDFIQQPISSASNVDRINILQPVEDALGFQFDIFSAPFLTVEGEEERKIFEKLLGEIKVANIINLKGSNNILPYLLASRMYKNYKGVFLLDADVDINTLIKGIGNPQLLIASLKDKILFIGKSIYNFEEFYQKIDSDDCIYYERKQDYDQYLTNECLEDFIATNIFESEFEGYKHLVKIAEEVISEFLSTHSDLKVKNPKRALECFLEKENKDKKFKVMVDCILKNITHENSQLKTDLHKKLKTRLKTKILDDTLNNRDLNKLSELISRINQKFLN